MRNRLFAIILTIGLISPSFAQMDFDGDNDVVVVDDSTLKVFQTNNFTASLWAYCDTQVTSGSWGLFSSGSTGGGGTWSIFRLNSDSTIGGHFQAGAAININSGVVCTTEWMHIAYTNDGSATRIYINGTQKSSGSSGTANTGVWQVVIGGWDELCGPGNSRCFHGKLDDVRFYTRALSDSEILNIYGARGTDHITEGLLGRWRMDEGPDGSTSNNTHTIRDISGNGKDGVPQNGPIYQASEWVLYP